MITVTDISQINIKSYHQYHQLYHSFANGSNDGPLASASLTNTWMFDAFDGPNIANPFLIITQRNHLVRKIDLNTGVVSTIAGQPGVSGSVDGPVGTNTIHDPMGAVISPDVLMF